MKKYLKKHHKLKDWFFYWIVVGAGTLVLFFLVTSVWIGYSVHEHCTLALGKYEEYLQENNDCVEALIMFLDDPQNSYGERNSAIWALGQLGDKRALPVLEKYYTGYIPAREPWDGGISQYELKKAINLASGGFNATAFVWRGN